MVILLPRLRTLTTLLLASSLAQTASANDVLETNGFSTCLDTDKLVVDRMNVKYDRALAKVTFDIHGTSKEEQKVRAILTVEAYGRELYHREFNPCDEDIKQLCPGTFVSGVVGKGDALADCV